MKTLHNSVCRIRSNSQQYVADTYGATRQVGLPYIRVFIDTMRGGGGGGGGGGGFSHRGRRIGSPNPRPDREGSLRCLNPFKN